MYSGLRARVKMEAYGDNFEIQNGVEQGDSPSPPIFN